jgi:tight adherence protein C
MRVSSQLAISLLMFGAAVSILGQHQNHKYQNRITTFLVVQPSSNLIAKVLQQLATKLPNREKLANRLFLVNSNQTIKQLRATQLSYALLGLVTAAIINLITIAESKLIFQLVIPIFSWAGWYLPISNLNSRYQRLRTELNFGFAEVVDLIALSVTAGSSFSNALIQVSEVVAPPWQGQLAAIRLDLTAGLSVATSLNRAASRMQHQTFSKFVAAVLISIERGTPLAAQLRTQSTEVAELLRQDLMKLAARKEAVMLLPVVFLILPTIVVATLFPGVLALGNLI